LRIAEDFLERLFPVLAGCQVQLLCGQVIQVGQGIVGFIADAGVVEDVLADALQEGAGRGDRAVRVARQAAACLVPLVRDMLPVGECAQDGEERLAGFRWDALQEIEQRGELAVEIVATTLIVGVAVFDMVLELFQCATTLHECREEVTNLLALITNQTPP